MTSAEFRDRLLARVSRAGGLVSGQALEALESYFILLARWNTKVNLTALPLDPPRDETFDRLFVEPIVAADHLLPGADVMPFAPVWFDLGSGGGSPAIPLKIVRPNWALTMVEARERKAAFLREAARTLRLSKTEVANVRFEDLLQSATHADLLTLRAVKVDAALSAVTTSLLRESGRVALFGVAQGSLPGFDLVQTVELGPSSVLTVLSRVPRGTKHS